MTALQKLAAVRGYSGNHVASFQLDQSQYFQQLAVKDTETLLTFTGAEVESGSSD
jgi:hypothetical protein